MTELDLKLDLKTDKIKSLVTNEKGQTEVVIFEDEQKLSIKDFIELFKFNMRCLVAGEIVSWEDHWRFTKQTDAKSFDMYLDNVEQEGILKGSRFSLNRQQKTNIMVWILIIAGVAILAAAFLYIVLSGKGGIKL